MAATDQLLRDALARDPARPLLTYYDDTTGERAELSATTLANWVAKTANLLVDELALEPGDRVAVVLPAHWQTAAVLLATWAAGGVATIHPDGAAVAFTDVPSLERVRARRPVELVALSLAPLGHGLASPQPGALDYAASVRAHGDRFASSVPDDAPAVDDDGRLLSGAALHAESRRRASELGLHVLDRVLSTLPWRDPADWVDGLLAPLAGGASLVLCAHPHREELGHRAEAEQVTATQGIHLTGVRSL
ncbi:MAG: TIGR03089 family protein [Actinobacteria bacterium]|nr:TIGR03089 family protein [Actinomycetota bacterium]MBI3687869.1 TIGR03089 family protein [Actinomycetota bacterium]